METAAEAVARGQAAYNAGHLDDALAAFETAIQREPQRAVPWYDAAATLFQLGRYAEARQRYVEARKHADGFLRTKIDYALGNTALLLGDIPAAIASYDDCLESTATGAGLDAVRATPRPIAGSHSSSRSPPRFLKARAPAISRNPSGRTVDETRIGAMTTAIRPDGQPETGQGGGGANPESDPNADGENNRPTPRRRRAGGAGGGRSTAPGTHGDSPDDRLDAALEHIRAAQSRRLPDDPPPATANDDRRDW